MSLLWMVNRTLDGDCKGVAKGEQVEAVAPPLRNSKKVISMKMYRIFIIK